MLRTVWAVIRDGKTELLEPVPLNDVILLNRLNKPSANGLVYSRGFRRSLWV